MRMFGSAKMFRDEFALVVQCDRLVKNELVRNII